MAVESLVLAVALIGLSKLVDLGFARLEAGPGVLAMGVARRHARWASLLGFLGAGIYEEALFRLALIPPALRPSQAPARPERAGDGRWR